MLALFPCTVSAQDTLRVSVDGPPAWGEPVALVEELRLGSLEGVEHETFGRVGGVVGMMDGTTVVADLQVPTIYVFAADGSFERRLGRDGEGPGEYSRINALASPGDGLVAVQDVRGGKVIVFSVTGEVVLEFSMYTGLNSVSETFLTDLEGRFYARAIVHDPANPVLPFDESPPVAWIRYDSDGALLDSVRAPDEDPVGPVYTVITPDGPRYPYTVETVSTIGPTGSIVWARNDRYAIHWSLADGRVVQLARNGRPMAVSDGERLQFETISSYFERRNDSRHDPVPRTKPMVRGIRADRAGRLWVERYTDPYRYEYSAEEVEARAGRPLIEWREAQSFDVYERRGRFLGTVRLPRRSQWMYADETRIWAVELGPFDEPYVVRYRLDVSDAR